jgi:hypothetical protein
MNFGVNEGFAFEIIYKYVPDYIEWLIKEVDNLYFHMDEFKNLPEPTPFFSDEMIQRKLFEKSNGIYPTEYLGVPFKNQSVAYALAVINDLQLQPRPYSAQQYKLGEKDLAEYKQLGIDLEVPQTNSFWFAKDILEMNEEKLQDFWEDDDSFDNTESINREMSREGWDIAFEGDESNYWNID